MKFTLRKCEIEDHTEGYSVYRNQKEVHHSEGHHSAAATAQRLVTTDGKGENGYMRYAEGQWKARYYDPKTKKREWTQSHTQLQKKIQSSMITYVISLKNNKNVKIVNHNLITTFAECWV